MSDNYKDSFLCFERNVFNFFKTVQGLKFVLSSTTSCFWK